jgi:hypothetical protein
MSTEIERNMGPQPVVEIMAAYNLKPHDLVAASTEQITHKMISRACKGRRLTPNTQSKILTALNAAMNSQYTLADLFTY